MPEIVTARFDLVPAERRQRRRCVVPFSQVVDIRSNAPVAVTPRATYTYDKGGAARVTAEQVGEVLSTWA